MHFQSYTRRKQLDERWHSLNQRYEKLNLYRAFREDEADNREIKEALIKLEVERERVSEYEFPNFDYADDPFSLHRLLPSVYKKLP